MFYSNNSRLKRSVLLILLVLAWPLTAGASGFGVFTQGASGLGQANAVVAHPTGPSSLYFNPALLNDVPGRGIEVGTTGIYSDRNVTLNSGGTEDSDDGWNFPSTFYYTHQVNDRLTAGFGVFFPFGLSNTWDDDYEGRYLGTSGEVLTMNINPAVSWRVTDRLSLAAGFSMLYMEATLESKINQTAAYTILQNQGAPLPNLTAPLADVDQEFAGDGWGAGYNLGLLYKFTDRISFGATYRSHIDVAINSADVDFDNVHPFLGTAFPETAASTDIRLPAQATAGVAFRITEPLVIEVGVRWEDWESTEELKIEFDAPVLGQTTNVTPRDWDATWTYNIGGQYRVNETWAINAGYLYGKNAVPDNTFEPIIPDTDAHLFTLGAEAGFGPWTIAGAFGYEHHEARTKDNRLGDPLGSILAGQPISTANGEYESDIYLVGLSVGYRF